jgi:fumarate reductase subunit D
MYKRSHEPIFWSLFGAGGMLAALVLPALIFITGIAGPLGWLPDGSLGFERLTGFAGSVIGGFSVWLVISLTLWHAAHRIYHSLHDLGVHRGLKIYKVACYGAALVGTVWSAWQVAALILA